MPFTNTNLEPDMMLMRPPDCSLHFQRTGGYGADEIPGSDQMAELGAFDISHDLSMIAGARPDIVLYGCTSATLTHGPEFDRNLAMEIERGVWCRILDRRWIVGRRNPSPRDLSGRVFIAICERHQ